MNKPKPQKVSKPRAKHYEPKLKINGTFSQAIKTLVTDNPIKDKIKS